jgi:hypothetical protein
MSETIREHFKSFDRLTTSVDREPEQRQTCAAFALLASDEIDECPRAAASSKEAVSDRP